MSPTPNPKDSSTRLLARLKPDLHISGIAGFLFAICLLADIIGAAINEQQPIQSSFTGHLECGLVIGRCLFPFLPQSSLAVGKGCHLAPGKVP